jgi:hypothetical protein
MIFARKGSISATIAEDPTIAEMRPSLRRELPLRRDEEIEIGVFEIETLTEMEIRQRPFEEIDTAPQMDLVPYQVLEPPFFAGLEQ